MRIDVLGSVRARRDDGTPVELGGPRHREVLARLVAAGGRMVPTDTLVDDLWADHPPPRAVGALRTFVGALRRALEPDRPPRTPPRLLVTEGPGYALRLPRADVDAHRFEDTLARARHDPAAAPDLTAALADWRGPAYADLPDRPWARRERTRLEELRLDGLELRARLLLDAAGARERTGPAAGRAAELAAGRAAELAAGRAAGRAAELAAELGAHVDEHPWREPAWALLARALHLAGRQADALAALRRARTLLGERLGLDPGAELQRLEADILTGATPYGQPPAAWSVPGGRLGPRTTVDLARTLSLAGGDALLQARRDRLAAIHAAERAGDPALTARVIGAYDVPALWSRADDAEQSRAVVEAAERTLATLGPDAPDALAARLLATVAVESRSADQTPQRLRRAGRAARRAEELARRLGDPALLAFALNGVFLQSFGRPGLAPERDRTGAEILDLATRHDLPQFAVLGRLVRLQSASALGDLEAAAAHARAAERLATTVEAPLVGVLTGWFRARAAAELSTRPGGPTAAEAAARYREADAALRTAGMPGLRRGLLPLALLGLRLLHGRPAPVDPRLDWGPYLPWARPHVLLAQGRRAEAADALAALPDPPPDHLQEALWCLTVRAAARLERPAAAARAAGALRGARAEHAGAAGGLLTLGPVAGYLDEADEAAEAAASGGIGPRRGR
ncbi:BTAD domain-containing putative transcriptional regulator [Kitasatospora phosalacinea]|uniref:BTAD domain-containing putative transcriptional regulator n=1 Tax=Kitasatospora phosalacinea TaxID=2065 RepID=UPI0005257CEA|nr:BTAD domain-containing putative transcriptional regulator [Kitasatospora phosalacinea]